MITIQYPRSKAEIIKFLTDIKNKRKADFTKAKQRQLSKIIVSYQVSDLGEKSEPNYIDIVDAWWYKLIIPLDSNAYHIWKIIIGLLSIICSVNYAYYTAFDFPFRYISMSDMFATADKYPLDTSMIIIWFIVEVLFSLDIVFCFFLEYQPEESFKPVRDISKIAYRYLSTNFLVDFIPTFPINYIIFVRNLKYQEYNAYKFIYILKVIRIRKASEILKSTYFQKVVDNYQKQRIKKIVETNSSGQFDRYKDFNKILEIIKVKQFFKIFRLGTLILVYSYLLALFWYILTELEYINRDPSSDDNEKIFFVEYNMNKNSDMRNCISMVYFLITTLSTIGFGDFHPKSNLERAFMTVILLSGVMLFSLLMGTFFEILQTNKQAEMIHEESNALSRFFGLMQKYNRRPLSNETVKLLERYFDFYWTNDKLVFIKTDDNLRFFSELPNDIRLSLFKDYLFSEFV